MITPKNQQCHWLFFWKKIMPICLKSKSCLVRTFQMFDINMSDTFRQLLVNYCPQHRTFAYVFHFTRGRRFILHLRTVVLDYKPEFPGILHMHLPRPWGGKSKYFCEIRKKESRELFLFFVCGMQDSFCKNVFLGKAYISIEYEFFSWNGNSNMMRGVGQSLTHITFILDLVKKVKVLGENNFRLACLIISKIVPNSVWKKKSMSSSQLRCEEQLFF